MNYVRRVDFGAFDRSGPDERVTQELVIAGADLASCAISCIKTPPGGGSPAGLHVHAVDQTFYILSGVMSIEVSGQEHACGPGSTIVFPAGVPHRNWNAGAEPTVHLAINTPAPDPNQPFARTVGA